MFYLIFEDGSITKTEDKALAIACSNTGLYSVINSKTNEEICFGLSVAIMPYFEMTEATFDLLGNKNGTT